MVAFSANGRVLPLAIMTMLSAIAQPASAAQPATSPPADTVPDSIVVKGQHEDKATVDHQAMSFQRQVQATPVQNQLARWHLPICPTVNGLDPQYADYVAARIRDVAKSAGIAVAGEDCRPNIFVTFTNDGAELVKAIEHVQPRTLFYETLEERKRLRSSELPVRWWYGTEIRGADGEDFGGAVSRGSAPSVISTAYRADITGAAVIIDASRATGYRLDAVAAYAAFVALGHFRVGAQPGATSSIMGLFDRPPASDDGMTKWDVAYLSALYATQADRTTDTQRHRIAGKMVKALAN